MPNKAMLNLKKVARFFKKLCRKKKKQDIEKPGPSSPPEQEKVEGKVPVDFTQEEVNWLLEKLSNINKLQSTVEMLDDELNKMTDELKADLHREQDKLEDANWKILEQQEEMQNLRKDLDRKNQVLEELKSEAAVIHSSINVLPEEMHNISEHKSKVQMLEDPLKQQGEMQNLRKDLERKHPMLEEFKSKAAEIHNSINVLPEEMHNISELQSTVQMLEDTLEQQNKITDQLTADLERKQEKLDEGNRKILEKQGEMQNLSKDLERKHQMLEELKSKAAEFHNSINVLPAEMYNSIELQSTVQMLEDLLEQQNKMTDQLTADLQREQYKLDEGNRKILEEQEEMQNHKKELERKHQVLEELKSKTAANHSSINILAEEMHNISELQSTVQMLEDQLEQQNKMTDQLTADLQNEQDKLEEANRKILEQQEEMQNLRKDLERDAMMLPLVYMRKHLMLEEIKRKAATIHSSGNVFVEEMLRTRPTFWEIRADWIRREA